MKDREFFVVIVATSYTICHGKGFAYNIYIAIYIIIINRNVKL